MLSVLIFTHRFGGRPPMPLAAAIGVEGGEEVTWELLDRDELHLIRKESSPVIAQKRA